jgi:hypothetical protein
MAIQMKDIAEDLGVSVVKCLWLLRCSQECEDRIKFGV